MFRTAHFLALIISVCLPGTADARDWFVHAVEGSNENDGTASAPLATAQAAVNRAGYDDRIILFPQGALYRQSINISSDKAGIVIEGNGVTLTGADPLPATGWESLGDNLKRIRLPRTKYDRHLLIVNSRAQRMGRLCSNPIDFPAVEDLKEGEFRWDHIDEEEGWLTYRGDTTKLEWSVRPNGLATSGDIRNIKVFDLNTKHFLNDGFNIHGNSRGMQFFNITGIENFDEGFSAHDDSTCWIRGGQFFRNEHAVADVNRADTYYTDCVFGESFATEVVFRGGRHSLTNCEIIASGETLPLSIEGEEDKVASLVLREVDINIDGLENRNWKIGPRVTVFIDQHSLEQTAQLELSKHSSSQIVEELYRTFPIGRNPDGSPLMAWVGGGTGNPRSSSYRIIHFDKHAPEEIASKISPENDWFGLMAPLPEFTYPPKPGSTDAETETARAVWTWIGLCAPNSVFVPNTPGGRSLGEALRMHAPAGVGAVNVFISEATEGAETRTSVLSRINEDLPTASDAMNERLRRNPQDIFEAISMHYGNEFDGSYLDALAVIAKHRAEASPNAERLAQAHLAKPVSPKPVHLGGTILFAHVDETWALDRLKEASNQAFSDTGEPLEAMPGHNEMSDSIFMAAPLLAATGAATGEAKYFDQCVNHIRFIRNLCLREDGLYRHSPQNEAAWGRGNGFPALGMALALEYLPKDHPEHAFIVEALQQHLEALAAHQSVDGLWHQLIDLSDTYPEFTASCMIAYSIACGIESGWLEETTWGPRLSSAWETIKTMISEDGSTFVNICPGTGKQEKLEDYYQREPLVAPDRRAGAVAMLLAQKLMALEAD